MTAPRNVPPAEEDGKTPQEVVDQAYPPVEAEAPLVDEDLT
jgi:hypothetical protein